MRILLLLFCFSPYCSAAAALLLSYPRPGAFPTLPLCAWAFLPLRAAGALLAPLVPFACVFACFQSRTDVLPVQWVCLEEGVERNINSWGSGGGVCWGGPALVSGQEPRGEGGREAGWRTCSPLCTQHTTLAVALYAQGTRQRVPPV